MLAFSHQGDRTSREEGEERQQGECNKDGKKQLTINAGEERRYNKNKPYLDTKRYREENIEAIEDVALGAARLHVDVTEAELE